MPRPAPVTMTTRPSQMPGIKLPPDRVCRLRRYRPGEPSATAYALAVDFGLTDEQRMILDTTREFVRRELLPLEQEVSRAEIQGRDFPDRQTLKALQQKAKSAGLWGLMTPEEYGGANVGVLLTAL